MAATTTTTTTTPASRREASYAFADAVLTAWELFQKFPPKTVSDHTHTIIGFLLQQLVQISRRVADTHAVTGG